MTVRYHTSAPPHCVSPRPHTDASQRLHTYGPLQPMDYAERLDHIVPRLRRLSAWLTYGALIALGALATFHGGAWALARINL